MIQRWRGVLTTEVCFHEGASKKGHDLALALSLPNTEHLTLGVDEEDDLRIALATGARLIVTVSGPRYEKWRQRAYPDAVSKHGPLCAPGEYGAPFHAVLLCARKNDAWLLLDPWFPADSQPFRIADDDFTRCFAGDCVIAR